MIEKVKIAKIYFSTQDKNSQPYLYKSGKFAGQPFTRVTIEGEDGNRVSANLGGTYGTKDLETARTWKEGDEVSLVIETNGDFTNWKIPSKNDLLEQRIAVLESDVTKLIKLIKK